MRKLIYIFLFLLAISSCTIETSDNGDLDGLWHLERIDTISTGGVCDMSGERIFWAVEHKMLQLRGGSDIYSFRFNDGGDSLILRDPYVSLAYDNGSQTRGDTILTDPQGLRQYGVQHLEEHFLKETMKGSRMVLRTDSFRLHFKKF